MKPTISIDTTNKTAAVTISGVNGTGLVQAVGLPIGETRHLTMEQADAHARAIAKHALEQAIARL